VTNKKQMIQTNNKVNLTVNADILWTLKKMMRVVYINEWK